MIGKYLWVFLISMVPIIELREPFPWLWEWDCL